MNWEIVFRCLEVGLCMIVTIWVAPLRRLQEKVEKAIEDKFSEHKTQINDHDARLRDLELGQVNGSSSAKDVFMTKEDFRQSTAERTHQMDIINSKLDSQTVQLTRLQTMLEVKGK